MDKHINLVKLSVGSDGVDSLIDWQALQAPRWEGGLPRHVTRMWPKRDAELLNGGSIYWVIKGLIQCRQRILRLDEVYGEDDIRRCAIVLDPTVHRTQSAPRRPFQGWRYLKPEDTPADLPEGRAQEEPLPADLSRALAEIGVL
ncbi:DUF1489 family protein [Tritonibacter horizontis]|uniref:Lysophospholipase n=1 Tax=Tritonibacter horizontis TaxID=1768241 RepID=A0A132C4W9_9RHOB|nr:DUF1489 domain-containing protein [Tritonibacter horizontis]KUP95080.1 hypothetical protein TRIHO_00380 [Tritonibacter horizontis]